LPHVLGLGVFTEALSSTHPKYDAMKSKHLAAKTSKNSLKETKKQNPRTTARDELTPSPDHKPLPKEDKKKLDPDL
jgi:hypothetical protein